MNPPIRLLAVALLVCSAVPGALARGAMPTQPAETVKSSAAGTPERWKGRIMLPGASLEFIVSLTPGDPPTAMMSIPAQGLKDGVLSDVAMSGPSRRFTLALPSMPQGAHASFDVTIGEDGQSAQGTMKQMGMNAPVEMTRLKEGQTGEPNRPQHPKPPFPYTARDVAYINRADGAAFAGTLTIPEEAAFGKGPHSAVLLITGSGPQDRDETLMGHKPFLVLADHLTRNGIAVLRVDDRGVGGSTAPKHGAETTDDFVGDALAGVDFLKTQPQIDPRRIGLIGHSEGGLIAPFAAVRSGDVAFLVLLAGTGVPGREILAEQLVALSRAGGAGEEVVERERRAQAEVFAALDRGADEAELRTIIRRIARAQMGLDEGAPETPEQAARLDAIEKAQAAAINSPWMRRFLVMDPREALRAVHVPVLALNGSLDRQVIAAQNLPQIERALKEAGDTDVTIRELPGLNHLFQHAATGSPVEYGAIEETLSPEVLAIIAEWIRRRTGLAP